MRGALKDRGAATLTKVRMKATFEAVAAHARRYGAWKTTRDVTDKHLWPSTSRPG
jgi:hypothetical protein